MKKMLFCCVLLLGFMSPVWAVDLMDIYAQALENDPDFKIAYTTYMSSRESIPQAQAALYPQLTLGAQTQRAYEDFVTSFTLDNTYYNSNRWQVNASQAVFNFQAWALVQQAKATVKASQATFNDSAQNLILRTAQAYFNILLSEDTLQFAEAKKRANWRQMQLAKDRLAVGIDTITTVYEAQAAYDQSTADVIAARNARINERENMRKLTNHVYENIASLRDNTIPLITPEPNDVEDWIDAGLRQNYKLLASKYTFQASRENIKVANSGSWPVLSFQGNANQVRNNNMNTRPNIPLPARNTNANVELVLNFPVYQGGLIESQTRQAQFDFLTASQRMEQTYRNVGVNSRIAFNTIIDGISKVKADRQSIISARNSLESTEAQFQAGTRVMVDVVNAQQELFERQLQLASDQYRLISALLNLKYLAGTLNVTDLEQINSWLLTTRINGLTTGRRAFMKH